MNDLREVISDLNSILSVINNELISAPLEKKIDRLIEQYREHVGSILGAPESYIEINLRENGPVSREISISSGTHQAMCISSVSLSNAGKTIGTLSVLVPDNYAAGAAVKQDVDLLAELYSRHIEMLISGLGDAGTERVERAANSSEPFDCTISKLYNLEHELRTPINAISGFCEILISGIGGEIEPRYQEYLAMIKTKSTLLEEIINNILDILKINNKGKAKKNVSFEVSELFSLSLIQLKKTAEKRKIILENREIPFQHKVQGDPSLLKKAFSLFLRMGIYIARAETTISVKEEPEDGLVRYRVAGILGADNGSPESRGISNLIKDTSLHSFGNQEKEQGKGIAIALIQGILALFGGELLYSRDETEFALEIVLPISECSEL